MVYYVWHKDDDKKYANKYKVVTETIRSFIVEWSNGGEMCLPKELYEVVHPEWRRVPIEPTSFSDVGFPICVQRDGLLVVGEATINSTLTNRYRFAVVDGHIEVQERGD